MIINVHAGHNPDGKVACGATGIMNESTEARAIKDKVIARLMDAGHIVYDCTVDDGTSQSDVLRRIVAKCNAHDVDLDVSIHLNSGRNDYIGDGSVGGTEAFVFNLDSKAAIAHAKSIVEQISDLGFRIRDDAIPDDIKTNSSLYVLKATKAQAVLVECCFVDDRDDVNLYQASGGAEAMAAAIANGINRIASPTPDTSTQVPPPYQTAASASMPATVHSVGDTVSINKIYSTATSTNALRPNITSGVITKILPGKPNPYLINGGDGWINDGCIISGMASAAVHVAPSQPTIQYYTAYTGGSNSITDALKSMGIDSSMMSRKSIASKNGITGYKGSYSQNVTMLTLLKQGCMIK